jgi:hypothetical protein
MAKEFIFARDTRVAGFGHAILFKANQPQNVPDILIPKVMSKGGVPVDGKPVDFGNENSGKPTPVGDARMKLIIEAFEDLVAENNPDNFGGNSRPRVNVLRDRLGFSVDAAERDRVWEHWRRNAEDE